MPQSYTNLHLFEDYIVKYKAAQTAILNQFESYWSVRGRGCGPDERRTRTRDPVLTAEPWPVREHGISTALPRHEAWRMATYACMHSPTYPGE